MKKLKYWWPLFIYGFKNPYYLDIYCNELFDLYYKKGGLIFEGNYFSHIMITYVGGLYTYSNKYNKSSVYLPFKYKGVKIKMKNV